MPKDGWPRFARNAPASKTVAPFEAKPFLVLSRDSPVFADADGTENIVTIKKGLTVESQGSNSKFWEVILFSGESRYIPKGNASIQDIEPVLPAEAVRKKLFAKISDAQDRARREADLAYPPETAAKDIRSHVKLQRVLDDKHTLDCFNQANVSPIYESPIVIEGIEKKW